MMSAENELIVVNLATGQYAIADRRCGNTVIAANGEARIIAIAESYPEVARLFNALVNPDHPLRYYTEYGGHLPPEDAFDHGHEPYRLFALHRVPRDAEAERCPCCHHLHTDADVDIIEADDDAAGDDDAAPPP